MENTLQNRHDLTDKQWEIIEPIIVKIIGKQGGSNAGDNRIFINGSFWIIRTGAPWRDLPPQYGKFGSVHKRFKRWCDKGVWEHILEAIIDNPDFEWLIIDATFSKVHPHACGAVGGNQDMSRTKGGLTPRYIWPWMRLVCQSELLLQKVPRLIVSKPSH